MKVMRQVANCNTVHPQRLAAADGNHNLNRFIIGEKQHHEENCNVIISKKTSEKIYQAATKRLKRSLLDMSRSQQQQQRQHNVVGIVHNQIELGEMIGQGSFSSVYEIKSIRHAGKNNENNTKDLNKERCAVKILRSKLLAKPSMLSACAADLVKEGLIMASLRHDNILSVKAWAPCGLEGYRSGRHDGFFLVLDRLQVTLRTRLWKWKKQCNKVRYSLMNREMKKFNFLNERLQVALQLANAIEYLHSKNILHRDLKPENIGFDNDGILKVFDFDVARMIPTTSHCRNCCNDDKETFLLSKHVGSPRYMSPEVALGDKYNLKADVYSFGLLLHQILSLEVPYNDINHADHDYLVFIKDVRPKIPQSWSPCIRSLIHKCWSPEIKTRPTISKAHSILKQYTSTLISKTTNERQ